MVARLSESFLRDVHLTEKSKELYDIDKTAWETVRDSLKDITRRIKRWFGKLSPDSTLGKIGEQMAAKNQEILDRFVAGVRAASENAAYIENTTDEGGVRMMSRDENNNVIVDEAVTKQSLAETLTQIYNSDKTSKPFTFPVLQHTPQVFLDYCYQYEDRSFVMPSDKAYNAMHGETKKQHNLGIDGLTDTLWNLHSPEYIILQTEGNNAGHHAAIVKSKETDTLVAVELGDYRDANRAIAGESGYYNTIITAFNDDQTYIDDLLTNSHNYILYDKSVDKKYEVPEQVASGESPSGHATKTSTNTIPNSSEKGNTSDKKRMNQSRDADYLSAVKRGDMETAQRMVDEAAERAFANSKIRGEDGKLIKVYHGTYADFTVFDKAMGRSSADIQGMFFSPWDIDAGGYGPNVRAFYLNITKPADERTGYKALNAHKGENYVGIKAREDLEKAGYDGVNNSDEEYIAFTSEQIKSADPVTYDDNGEVIPLSQRFNTDKQDIRYQSRGDYADALSPGEWFRFNKAIIGDNQYASYKIGKTGVCIGNTLIVYNGKKYDPHIKAVYNLGDYEYNIHDGIDNVAELFINELEVYKDEKRAETILQKYSSIYGTIFKRYKPESNRYVELSRAGDTDREANRQGTAGTGVSGGTQQTGGVKFDSRDDWMDLIGEDEDLLFSEYDDISDMVAHQYTTHSEAIGEVLRNTADIDIAAGKVRNIVSRLFNARYSNIDAQTQKMLLYFCGLCGTINTDYLTGGILYDHQRRYHRRRT